MQRPSLLLGTCNKSREEFRFFVGGRLVYSFEGLNHEYFFFHREEGPHSLPRREEGFPEGPSEGMEGLDVHSLFFSPTWF
jgi:hypothetical protein